MNGTIAVAIHGGAGALKPGSYPEAQVAHYREFLHSLVVKAESFLRAGDSALETVLFLCQELENFEHFNSGKGSVLNALGEVEMDASIMDGKSGNGGGVSGIRTIRNPILAANIVRLHSKHSLLAGESAEDFGLSFGLTTEAPEYFITQQRKEQLEKAKETKTISLDHGGGCTIGAVALDADGNLAAGTSTGGLTNKHPGRVSDSAIIGAGTFASNETCAISGTGTGDKFILNSFANSVHLLMKHAQLSLQDASKIALDKIKDLGGEGGCIAIDREGNVCCPFNSDGMFRAFYTSKNSSSGIGIYDTLLEESII